MESLLLEQHIKAHMVNLAKTEFKDDMKEYINDEIQLAMHVIEAPSMPILSFYKVIKESEVSKDSTAQSEQTGVANPFKKKGLFKKLKEEDNCLLF